MYTRNITPLLEGKGLPPNLLDEATDSIGGTNGVADALAASGQVPAAAVAALREAANAAFMPAFHTAAFVSTALLVIAFGLIVWRLPAKAEAVAWAGTHAAPGDEGDAAHAVHAVSEEGDGLAHVEDAPHALADEAPRP